MGMHWVHSSPDDALTVTIGFYSYRQQCPNTVGDSYMRGFSTRNLKYMRTFTEAYPNEEFVYQLGHKFPGNIAVLSWIT